MFKDSIIVYVSVHLKLQMFTSDTSSVDWWPWLQMPSLLHADLCCRKGHSSTQLRGPLWHDMMSPMIDCHRVSKMEYDNTPLTLALLLLRYLHYSSSSILIPSLRSTVLSSLTYSLTYSLITYSSLALCFSFGIVTIHPHYSSYSSLLSSRNSTTPVTITKAILMYFINH